MENLCNHLLQINWLAVIVVILLSFVLGALWHSSLLFGKAWKAESGFQQEKVKPTLIFGGSAIAHLIAVTALAAVIGTQDAVHGLLSGLFISVCWIATSMGATYLFATRTLKIFLIDAGFYVVFFAVAGLILGAWH